MEGGEDSLGPVEPPFPSTAFVRNFSLDYRHVWNEQFDPFHLYPSLPWDPTLSSDAKFVGKGGKREDIYKCIGLEADVCTGFKIYLPNNVLA